MTDVAIREATAGDVPAIRRVAERGWNAAYGDIVSQATIDAAMDEWYAPDSTRAAIEREDVTYLVAERDRTVLGYVSGGPGDETTVAHLGAIYVDPDHWGAGIGTALLSAFESACRERGYDGVRFEVLAENDVGTSFYRSHGFAVVEERTTDLFGESVRERVFAGPLG